jgi:DNA-binding beta-propeller fold protein YncE
MRPVSGNLATLAVAPDGNDAYALLVGGRGRDILHLDLQRGTARELTALPGQSVGGLAVTQERIYATDSLGSAVWAVDRRTGQLVQTIPVGRNPIALTLSGRH